MPSGKHTPFTEEEKEQIFREYLIRPTSHISKELSINKDSNVTPSRIRRFLERNGLKIPQKQVNKWRKNGRFNKGHIPANTGLKQHQYMTPEGIERSKKHRFKKGVDFSKIPIGGFTTWKRGREGKEFKYIKVGKREFKLYHHVIWEEANGAIPKDFIVVFIDDNQNNIKLSNLKMIPLIGNFYDDIENKYPDEIIPTLVLINDLKNKLNQF